MYKHLVVAVDGSETSLNALKHAAELASVNNARLTLVHVANPAEYMALAPEFLQHESYEAAAVAQGNEVLDFAEKTALSSWPSIVKGIKLCIIQELSFLI